MRATESRPALYGAHCCPHIISNCVMWPGLIMKRACYTVGEALKRCRGFHKALVKGIVSHADSC